MEGCTGWRYVVEELATRRVVAHLADPAETAGLRGPKKRAKTDRADARLLRTLLLEGRFPESWIPPAHVVEVRTLGRLYCALMDERRAWQQRIHAQLFHQGCPPIRALLTEAGRDALAQRRAVGGGTAVRGHRAAPHRRADRRNRPGAWAVGQLCAAPGGVSGAAGPPVRGGLVVCGDHVGRDRRCAPVLQFRSAGAFRRLDVTVYSSDGKRSPGHLSRQGSPELRWATFEAAKCAARPGPPTMPTTSGWRPNTTADNGKNPTLAVERKILRRSYHTLRELGDAALAMPVPEERGWPPKCVVRVPCP